MTGTIYRITISSDPRDITIEFHITGTVLIASKSPRDLSTVTFHFEWDSNREFVEESKCNESGWADQCVTFSSRNCCEAFLSAFLWSRYNLLSDFCRLLKLLSSSWSLDAGTTVMDETLTDSFYISIQTLAKTGLGVNMSSSETRWGASSCRSTNWATWDF